MLKTPLVLSLSLIGAFGCAPSVGPRAECTVTQSGDDALEVSPAHRGKFAHRGRGHRPGGPMKRFDKNADGVLDAAEIAAMPERVRERVLNADADKDGKVTVDELKAAFAKRGHEHFVKNDKNADGFLTKDEVGDEHWSHMSVADANNDGKLSEDELIAAHRDGKLQPPRGAWRHHKQPTE